MLRQLPTPPPKMQNKPEAPISAINILAVLKEQITSLQKSFADALA